MRYMIVLKPYFLHIFLTRKRYKYPHHFYMGILIPGVCADEDHDTEVMILLIA